MPSGTWVFISVWPSERGCQRGESAEAVVISVQRQRIRVVSFALLQWVCLTTMQCLEQYFRAQPPMEQLFY